MTEKTVLNYNNLNNIFKLLELLSDDKNRLKKDIIDEFKHIVYKDYLYKFKECCYKLFGHTNNTINNLIKEIYNSELLGLNDIDKVIDLIDQSTLYKYLNKNDWKFVVRLLNLKTEISIIYTLGTISLKMSENDLNNLFNNLNNNNDTNIGIETYGED